MVSPLLRSSLREIRQSMGRYAAILAIVALGVSFFSGLRMAEPNMKVTGRDYLGTYELHDFRLLSTLGWEEEDVDYFAGLDQIGAAQGSYYTEFLWQNEQGEDVVLMAQTLMEEIDTPKLLSGRLPQRANECLADGNYFSEADLGRTLTLSPNNEEDTLELLACGSYTIVGIADSPTYLNYERGTASIGSGTVSAFLLLPPDGFDAEAYHEICLRFREAPDAYSQGYDDQVDDYQPALKELTEVRAHRRYTQLYTEAAKELAEGEEELADGWEEYYDGLAELEEGKQDYADGLKDYEEGQEDLLDAEEEVSEGWADYRSGKEEAEQQLKEAKKALDQGQTEYEEGLAQYEAGLEQLTEAKKPLEEADSQLAASKEALDEAKAELDKSKAQLEAGEAALLQAEQLYQSGQALADAFSPGSAPAQLLAAAEADPALAAALDGALQAQGSSLSAFRAGWTAAEAALGAPFTQETLDALQTQLTAGRTAYEEGLSQYEAGLRQYEAGYAQAQEGWALWNSSYAQAQAAKAELDKARDTLDQGWEDYRSGKREAEKELARAKEQLEEAEEEIAQGWEDLAQGKEELEDAALEIAEAEEELADGYQELLDGQADLEEGYEELADLEEPDVFVLTRNENASYVSFDNDTNIIKAIAVVFPAFFYLVAALVCMTTMTRMVDEQRTQIGVLKALGYSNGQILGKYVLYSGSAALVGYALGYGIGSALLPWIIWEIYAMMYGFAELQFTFDPGLALLSFVAAMASSVGVTVLACTTELRRQSAELLRPKAPKAGKRVFLEYVTPVWKRLSFLQKVSVRNVFRYRSRLIMMLLGIGGCTALLITGYGIQDSIASIGNIQYDEIFTYDYSVTFQDPLTQAEADGYLADLGWEEKDGLLLHSSNADVVTGGGVKNVFLSVPAQGTTEGFVSLTEDGAPIPYPQAGEAVMTIGLAQRLGLAVGDTFQLRDDDLNTITVTLSGICENYINYYVYLAPETYETMTGSAPEYKTLFVQAHEGADPYAESVLLASGEDVTSIQLNASSRASLNGMLSRMDYVVVVVVVFAIALAFVVLYNLTNINISERVREIATIKVLGFYRKETASYVFRETYLLSALGSLVGVGLGTLLHAYVMSQVQVDGVYFPCRVTLSSYLISVALTLIFTLVICQFLKKKLDKVDMAESLKSIE